MAKNVKLFMMVMEFINRSDIAAVNAWNNSNTIDLQSWYQLRAVTIRPLKLCRIFRKEMFKWSEGSGALRTLFETNSAVIEKRAIFNLKEANRIIAEIPKLNKPKITKKVDLGEDSYFNGDNLNILGVEGIIK